MTPEGRAVAAQALGQIGRSLVLAIAAQALTRVGHALVPATPGDHHNHPTQPSAQLGLFKEEAHGQEQEV